jgi:hypothetical protein
MADVDLLRAAQDEERHLLTKLTAVRSLIASYGGHAEPPIVPSGGLFYVAPSAAALYRNMALSSFGLSFVGQVSERLRS